MHVNLKNMEVTVSRVGGGGIARGGSLQRGGGTKNGPNQYFLLEVSFFATMKFGSGGGGGAPPLLLRLSAVLIDRWGPQPIGCTLCRCGARALAGCYGGGGVPLRQGGGG